MGNKKILRSTLIGFLFLLVSMAVVFLACFFDFVNGGTGTLNGQEFVYGPRAALNAFLHVWRPASFPHVTGFIGLVLVLVAVVLALLTFILGLAKKKPALLLTAIFLGAAIGFLPFILILTVPMVEMGVIGAKGVCLLAGALGLDLFAIIFLLLPASKALKGLVYGMAGVKKECCKDKKGGIDEDAVRALIKEELDAHVEELHPEGEPVPAPVEEEKEPEPEEEPEEEPEQEPEEEESDEGEEEGEPVIDEKTGLVIKGRKRRASFETRLRNSEFDLRHKYYDLRDYIKWYGLRNRVSIPGDTFSYKRQRYVFITIIGKHIRVYLDLDPKNYEGSTMPVEPSAAKKYEDLPCLLRVKSDLSYRRAKKLVDDVMEKVGLPRPEGDEPKETQDQEQE